MCLPELEKAGSTDSAKPVFVRISVKSILFSAKILPNFTTFYKMLRNFTKFQQF